MIRYKSQRIKQDIIVRQIKIADFEKINNFEYYHNWRKKIGTYLSSDVEKSNLQERKEAHYKAIQEPETYLYIGAFNKEKLIGIANLHMNPNKSKMSHIGKWGIFIHPNYHNQGIGFKILTLMEVIAKQKGIKKLEASYFRLHKAAERLYLNKLGYTIEGIRKCARYADNTYTDGIEIGKLIDPDLEKKYGNEDIIEVRLVAKALIIHNERILILTRSKHDTYKPGSYDLPGGGIENGESYKDGIVREIKEETGLDVNIIIPYNLQSWRKGKSIQYEGLSFLATSNTDKVNLSHEHDSYLWVDFRNVENIIFEEWQFQDITKGIKLYNILKCSKFF